MAHEKSPAFQFYPKDFLMDGNVQGMSLAERGAYITLLCICWQDGSLPNNEIRLSRMLGLPLSGFRKIWPAVRTCFTPKGDAFVHKRLDAEREKQEQYRNRQSEKGRLSAARRATDIQPEVNRGSTVVQPDGQPKVNSPISDLQSSVVPKEQELAAARSKHPIFKGQRLVVFEWQLDKFMQILGPLTNDFDLHGWFGDLDEWAARTMLAIPQRDGGQWLEGKLLEECKRRRLPVAQAQRAGRLTTNLAAALENIQVVGE